jgi:hypothetical protein
VLLIIIVHQEMPQLQKETQLQQIRCHVKRRQALLMLCRVRRHLNTCSQAALMRELRQDHEQAARLER